MWWIVDSVIFLWLLGLFILRRDLKIPFDFFKCQHSYSYKEETSVG